jgi:hypothetical protein
MSEKLTDKQFRELVAFHNKAVSGKVRTGNITRIITDPEEVAKIAPQIISHYTIRRRRPPAGRGAKQ